MNNLEGQNKKSNKALITTLVIIGLIVILAIVFYFNKQAGQEKVAEVGEDDSIEIIGADLNGIEKEFNMLDQTVESDFQEVDNMIEELK